MGASAGLALGVVPGPPYNTLTSFTLQHIHKPTLPCPPAAATSSPTSPPPACWHPPVAAAASCLADLQLSSCASAVEAPLAQYLLAPVFQLSPWLSLSTALQHGLLLRLSTPSFSLGRTAIETTNVNTN